jgi:hypothetical protein
MLVLIPFRAPYGTRQRIVFLPKRSQDIDRLGREVWHGSQGSAVLPHLRLRDLRGPSGRKRIVAPDGSAIAPTSKPQPDGTLVKALTRAWRWQKLLDAGGYTSVSEIGDAENISKSYVSRILRLALLAPDIVEAILSGQSDQALMLDSLSGRCQ